MKAQIIRLTLLNHLFYYTEVSGGGASATITGAFLGDLALNYALHRVLRNDAGSYRYVDKPDYSELKQFGFYCSVAKPETKPRRTDTYIHNTLFNCDGYIDKDCIQKSGKSPYKNYRQVQGIAIGSTFLALVLSENTLHLPPTIRMGRAKETLIRVDMLNEKNADTNDFWLNAFTLKTVFNNLDAALNLLQQEQKMNFTYVLENYNLLKKISLQNAVQIFEGKI